jgi:hypothetical protein
MSTVEEINVGYCRDLSREQVIKAKTSDKDRGSIDFTESQRECGMAEKETQRREECYCLDARGTKAGRRKAHKASQGMQSGRAGNPCGSCQHKKRESLTNNIFFSR